MKVVKYKNISGKQLIRQEESIGTGSEYIIHYDDLPLWASDDVVLSDITNDMALIGNGCSYFDSYKDQLDYLLGSISQDVSTTSELSLPWGKLKDFYNNTTNTFMNYVEVNGTYFVWVSFRDQKIYCPKVENGTADGDDFENNYKDKCNVPEDPKTRITNCKIGRKLHDRYISFQTSCPYSVDNNNYMDVEYDDMEYFMKDVNGDITEDPSKCKETWLFWEPTYDYEIFGGFIDIPDTLSSREVTASSIYYTGSKATVECTTHSLKKYESITIADSKEPYFNGIKRVTNILDENYFQFDVPEPYIHLDTGSIRVIEDDNSWEIHVVGAPKIPAVHGGSIELIANPRMKWKKGKTISTDSSINPADLLYNQELHSNELLFIVKHPLAARDEFQINLKMYKSPGV